LSAGPALAGAGPDHLRDRVERCLQPGRT
jgi:hypothetical protein